MIATDKKVRTVEGSAPLDQMDYFIDQKNIVHITAMLRNMYSNPVRACIREYAANAIDAHMLGGKADTPIKITVPSTLSPVFKVRDFGPGLSIEDSKQLLCGFGSSGDHKRTSNAYVGGFGIGAKVGFAVSSAFTYTIWHNGIKRIWSNFLDEFDASKASLLSETESDEPTGVEVAVPVEATRIDEFIEELQNAFTWYDIKPVMEGATVTLNERPTTVVSDTLHIMNKGVRMPVEFAIAQYARGDHDHEAAVVMGNIEYPLEVSTTTVGIDYNSLSGKKRKIIDNLIIKAPIGFFQLAPSRESLQYSQSTKAMLNKILEKVLEEGYVLSLFKNKTRTAVTVKEAYTEAQYYGDMLNESPEDCLKTLYPQFKHYILKNAYGEMKFRLFGREDIPSSITDNDTDSVYVSTRPETWYGDVGQKSAWTVKGGQINHTFFALQLATMYTILVTKEEFKKLVPTTGFGLMTQTDVIRRLMLFVSKDNRADWMPPKGSNFIQYLNTYYSEMGLIILVTEDKDKFRKSKDWSAVKDGLVTEIPSDVFLGYTLSDADGMVDVHIRQSVRSRRNGGGVTKTVAHSRKFSKLNTKAIGYGRKHSDSWDSLLAKDVDSALGYSVPMDEFIMCGSRNTGFYGDLSDFNVDRSDMSFVQGQWLSNSGISEHVFENKPIIGIRKKEYDSTVQKYGFTPMWQKVKTYFADYRKKHGITNNHLGALYMLSTGKSWSHNYVGMMNPESVKLYYTVMKEVLDSEDITHPMWDEASKWVPYFDWAHEQILTKEPEAVAFVKMFMTSHNHWLGTHQGENKLAHIPFIGCADDEKYWNSIGKALSAKSNHHTSKDMWMKQTKLDASGFELGIDIAALYTKYPGLTAFLPDDCNHHFDSGKQHKEFMWHIVLRQDQGSNGGEVDGLTKGLVKHIIAYINSVKPITKEV
jgi:hypothetical protein